MNLASKFSGHRKALDIAQAAMEASRRTRRLERCRELLEQLDPEKPPLTTQAREFHWQCRALRERVHVCSQRLATVEDPDEAANPVLSKTDWALELSLQYFRDVLTPPMQKRDEDSGIDTGA